MQIQRIKFLRGVAELSKKLHAHCSGRKKHSKKINAPFLTYQNKYTFKHYKLIFAIHNPKAINGNRNSNFDGGIQTSSFFIIEMSTNARTNQGTNSFANLKKKQKYFMNAN
jgi:hypothetical protein